MLNVTLLGQMPSVWGDPAQTWDRPWLEIKSKKAKTTRGKRELSHNVCENLSNYAKVRTMVMVTFLLQRAEILQAAKREILRRMQQ